MIKLDIALVRGINADPARRALVSALACFATGLGITLIAEGIETRAELAALHDLGVTFGQGYHLGRPAAVDAHDLTRDHHSGVPWEWRTSTSRGTSSPVRRHATCRVSWSASCQM